MNADLLIVAGEASGDRAGAAVLARLDGVRAFGMGGGALARARMELLCDLRSTTALGVAEVASRAVSVGVSYARLRAAIALRRPKAALLVNYTEFNTHLACALHDAGTRVLWYGAPQIWAWRSGRAATLRPRIDRMAVMLPFEEDLWRRVGVDAHYVGHPALEERRVRAYAEPDEEAREARTVARELLGMTARAWCVGILPGSRPHEVHGLLEPMLEGYEIVRRDRASVDARVLLAPSLDAKTKAWAKALSARFRTEVVDIDARAGIANALPAFDAALCASGTASLECTLAGAVPVVCYRVGLATELGARALMTTPHIALPNVLLGEAVFPELVQRALTPSRIAEALTRVLDERRELLDACERVARVLEGKPHGSLEVARILRAWMPRTDDVVHAAHP